MSFQTLDHLQLDVSYRRCNANFRGRERRERLEASLTVIRRILGTLQNEGGAIMLMVILESQDKVAGSSFLLTLHNPCVSLPFVPCSNKQDENDEMCKEEVI